MKRSVLLFGIMLTLTAPINPVWSGEKVSEKPPVAKKHTPAKKHRAGKKPEATRASPETSVAQAVVQTGLPQNPPTEAVAPIAAPAVAEQVPMRATSIETEAPSATTPRVIPNMAAVPVVTGAIIIAPPKPAVVITPLPPPTGNPYLQPILVRPVLNPPPIVVVPVSDTNPFGNLKSALFSFLPDGIGQMHPPIFWELIRGSGKPLLLVQVSCPTKALFGFDTPVVAALQLGVDQIIEIANGTNLLPAEIQKVCR